MSDYEDGDLDDDLPCVSLSQSTIGKSELEMPPASQLASSRAREEAAERALQDLHENNDPLLVSLSRSTSQSSTGEEGEAALSAAVSALQVTDTPGTRGLCAERLQLLMSIRDHFPEDDLLNSYVQMLKDKPETVNAVTEYILKGISSDLIRGRSPPIPSAAAWLLCVALSTPRALRVRRALHAILDGYASDGDVKALGVAFSTALEDADQLVAAHDAVRTGAGRGADVLAAALLAHATQAVLAQEQAALSPSHPPSPLSASTVARVRAAWRRLPARAQLTLLRCAGRALAQGDKDGDNEREKENKMDTDDITLQTEESVNKENNNTIDCKGITQNMSDKNRTDRHAAKSQAKEIGGGAALLAALSQPLPRASAMDINRQQVSINLSKLQLLFRHRYIREPPEEPGNEILDCSQNSIDSIHTPTKENTIEMKIKIPMKLVTPMKLTYPILKTPEIKDKSKIKTVKGQLKLDGFFKQGTQVKVVKDENTSPEPKRMKRRPERRRAEKSEKS